MILGMEIALTVLGLYMLITGKALGKNAVPHWQFRLVGGFALTVLPVALVAVVIYGVVWAMNHPGSDPQTIQAQVTGPARGIEFGIVVLWAIIATVWERSVRKRATAAQQAGQGATFSQAA